ncbi:hypothetical protein [Erythrobacter sp.]|uniref:hypothetical protein n=1 Tax=Erythrobacter sp. TaxID=1042 RepID=UPI0025E78B29|nr:hypothetical protein [Erythrobacter sp.]
MIDRNEISQPLPKEFICVARLAEYHGYAIGSTFEQIVAALINGRANWLPSSYPEPLGAIKRLHAGGADWWHTALYVHGWTGVSSCSVKLALQSPKSSRSVDDKSRIIRKIEAEGHRMGRVYAQLPLCALRAGRGIIEDAS